MSNQIKVLDEINGKIRNTREELDQLKLSLIDVSKKARKSQDAFNFKTPKEVSKQLKQNTVYTEQLVNAQKEQERLEKTLIKQIAKRDAVLESTNRELQKQRFETQQLNRKAKEHAIISSKLSTEYQKQSVILNQLTRKKQELLTKQAIGNKLTEKERKELSRVTKEQKKLDAALKDVDKQVGRNFRNVGNYQSGLKGLAGTFRSLIGAFGLTVGATVFIDMLKEANELAKTLEGRSRRANIVFGDSLGYITEQAEKNALVIGTTKSEYVGAAAAVADLLVPLGFQRDVSAQLAAETVNLSGALSDWVGGQYSATEVSEILQKAILGETEQLKQLGIVIDQSSKDFNNRIKQLEVEQNLTREQARALDILNQIQTKSVDAQTAFADGASSIAIQQERANAKLREAKELFATKSTSGIIFGTQTYTKWLNRAAEGLEKIDFALNSNISIIDKWKLGINSTTKGLSTLIPWIEEGNGLFQESTDKLIADNKEREKNAQNIINQTKAFIALNGSLAPLTQEQQKENEERRKNILFVEEEIKQKKTLAEINLEISKLNQSLEGTRTREEAKIIQDQIKALEAQKEAILGSSKAQKEKTNAIKDSIQYLQSQVSKLEDLRDKTSLTNEEYEEFNKQIDVLKFQISELNGEYDEFLDSLNEPLPEIKFEDLFKDGDKKDDKNFYESLNFIDIDEMDALEQLEYFQELEKNILDDRLELRKEFYGNLKKLAFSSINAIFDAEVEKYNDRIDANNEYYNALLDNENLTEKQRDAIEAERQRKNEELERKKRETEKKSFLFGQAAALAEVVISTTKAVAAIKAQVGVLLSNPLTAPLAPLSLSQIPFVIGSGAAAAGAIVATSIPQFKDGHLAGTHEGAALINDASGSNFQEIVERKDGRLEIFKNRNQFITMERGDKVHKAGTFDGKDILKQSLLLSMQGQQEKLSASQEKQLNIGQELQKAFKNFRPVIQNNNTNNNSGLAKEIAKNLYAMNKINKI